LLDCANAARQLHDFAQRLHRHPLLQPTSRPQGTVAEPPQAGPGYDCADRSAADYRCCTSWTSCAFREMHGWAALRRTPRHWRRGRSACGAGQRNRAAKRRGIE